MAKALFFACLKTKSVTLLPTFQMASALHFKHFPMLSILGFYLYAAKYIYNYINRIWQSIQSGEKFAKTVSPEAHVMKENSRPMYSLANFVKRGFYFLCVTHALKKIRPSENNTTMYQVLFQLEICIQF